MQILKKTYSINNNEIVLLGSSDFQKKDKTYKKILIIGVFHGDEPQGKFLIENYLNSIYEESKYKNKLFFIPCLNPDGLNLKTRQNANNVDLNRNFPTKNWAKESLDSEYYGGDCSSSEAEAKFVEDVVNEISPNIILTLHAPYKIVNYDGPAEKVALEISKIINYPVQNDIGYPTPGSFGTYSGIERNIPTITLELDEEIDVKELISPVNKIFDYLANIQ